MNRDERVRDQMANAAINWAKASTGLRELASMSSDPKFRNGYLRDARSLERKVRNVAEMLERGLIMELYY